MKIKENVIVITCAVIVFVAGMVVGNIFPRCGGKHQGHKELHGFHNAQMVCDKCDCKGDHAKCTCDEDCSCKRKKMHGCEDVREGVSPVMEKGCDCQKDKRSSRGERKGRGEKPVMEERLESEVSVK